jgi:preprotein translocase subunit SecF
MLFALVSRESNENCLFEGGIYMDARFYRSDNLSIERLATDLENFFRGQGYQVQQIGNNDQVMVQLKKGSDFEALIGMQAALSVTIQRTTGGIMVAAGQQKWVDKAAVGVVGVAVPALWPLLFTAGVGAVRQASLANQVLTVLDGLVRQQQPDVKTGPVPA